MCMSSKEEFILYVHGELTNTTINEIVTEKYKECLHSWYKFKMILQVCLKNNSAVPDWTISESIAVGLTSAHISSSNL